MRADGRPDPDELLARLRAQDRSGRGCLRIWLGAAPGVGTTYAMLQEGHRRQSRGTDVVIGLVETHGRAPVEALLDGLELVPPQVIEGNGAPRRELDTAAVLARHPAVVLIDEPAHVNAPHSRHARRYEDIEELLAAGITVITTLNVQHVESLAGSVEQLTGVAVPERLPDRFVDGADQIELVDLPAADLLRRLEDGELYPDGISPGALGSLFTASTLTALRDLALRVTVREVEEHMDCYRLPTAGGSVPVGERIVVAVDGERTERDVLRRGWRLAAALKGELEVVYVAPPAGGGQHDGVGESELLRATLTLAGDLGAAVVQLQGNTVEELIAYSRSHGVSHLFIGARRRRRPWQPSMVFELLRRAPELHLHVIGEGPTGEIGAASSGRDAPGEGGEGPSPALAGGDGDGDAEEEQAPAEGAAIGRGRLRLYLGAAPGVGKTFAMLQEAHRLRAHGRDVVVGLVETHGRTHTADQLDGLEVIPPREIQYRGVLLHEPDITAIAARRPEVVLLDELAHTNVPGSRHEKRYEDILELLQHGMDVVTTVNVQHLESLNDLVERTIGVRVRETVPDWVVDEADEVELIDMAPEALIRRMVHGNIYPPDSARRALEHFFTPAKLAALRDLALRATAREVEARMTAAMREASGPPDRETVMVAAGYGAAGKSAVREGRRMAAALGAALLVVHVEPAAAWRRTRSPVEERQLRASLQLATELGARVVRVRGGVAEELIAQARSAGVTQVVLGRSSRGRWARLLHGSVTADLIAGLHGVDVHVIPSAVAAREDA